MKTLRKRFGSKPFLIACGVLVLSFLWFWFWRPYGFYGGDSEFLDRQVNGGLWFRKRELLALAAMQLSRQIFTLHWGWPVSWSISLASSIAGAFSVLFTWLLCRDQARGPLRFALILSSGYLLLYHGSIEAYALPTSVLMFWILAIDHVHRGDWPVYSIAFAFVLMAWCHLMALFLLPSLLATARIYREVILREERIYWSAAAVCAGAIYVVIDILQIGQGEGFGFWDLFYHANMPGTEETGTFLTIQHLKIKLYFLWLATHITLPFAIIACWKDRTDIFVIQVAGMLLGALVMVIFFHPDCGYDDWDLFLLPSLPAATLAARSVSRIRYGNVIACIWVLAFLSIWSPRVPTWARLPERGLATITIPNFPSDREVYWVHGETNHYYRVLHPEFYAPGGDHRIAVKKAAYVTQFQDFTVSPQDQIEVFVPIKDIEVPFADRMRKMIESDDESP